MVGSGRLGGGLLAVGGDGERETEYKQLVIVGRATVTMAGMGLVARTVFPLATDKDLVIDLIRQLIFVLHMTCEHGGRCVSMVRPGEQCLFGGQCLVLGAGMLYAIWCAAMRCDAMVARSMVCRARRRRVRWRFWNVQLVAFVLHVHAMSMVGSYIPPTNG